MDDGLRMVEVGACSVWPLPGDPTCAGVARRVYRRAAAGLALEPSLVDDGVMMVSELAANTLHVQQEQGDEEPAPRSAPELWLYLRGIGPRRELVCKIFDSFPGWLRGNVPGRGVGQAPADAVSGRGLEVVHELSQGRWGHHLTRSRLAGWDVRGKAVWFAVPAIARETTAPATAPGAGPAGMPGARMTPNGAAPALPPEATRLTRQPPAPPVVPVPRLATPDRYAVMPASQAMTELEAGLAARGFSGKLVRADDPAADMAVLSVCAGVTVWCRAGVAWLRTPGLAGHRWGFCDLVEVAEQTVQAYETLAAKGELQELAEATTRTGALPRLPSREPAAPDRASPGQRRATRRYAAQPPRSGPRRSQSPPRRSG